MSFLNRSIINKKLYQTTSPKEFDLILKIARQSGFKIKYQSKEDFFFGRAVGEFAWSPDIKTQHFMQGQGGVDFLEVAHHLVHYLCYSKCNFNTVKKPKAILFFENLACNLDSYFAVMIIRKIGIGNIKKHFLDQYPFSEYEKNRERLGITSRNYLERLTEEDPFEFYTKMVSLTDCLQNQLAEIYTHFVPGTKPSKSLKQIHKIVTKNPDFLFVSHFNYMQHHLFAHFNEGISPNPKDLKSKQKIYDILFKSNTLCGFLKSLQSPD